MALVTTPEKEPVDHRFLDEAGDTTFYGSGKKLILGQEGVSLSFIIGMLKISEPLPALRAAVVGQQTAVAADAYVNAIPSVAKKIARGGFFFHAKDDPSEIRATFFKFIATRQVTFEAVVPGKFRTSFGASITRVSLSFMRTSSRISSSRNCKSPVNSSSTSLIAPIPPATPLSSSPWKKRRAAHSDSAAPRIIADVWCSMSRITSKSPSLTWPIIFAGPCSGSSSAERRAITIFLANASGSSSIFTIRLATKAAATSTGINTA